MISHTCYKNEDRTRLRPLTVHPSFLCIPGDIVHEAREVLMMNLVCGLQVQPHPSPLPPASALLSAAAAAAGLASVQGAIFLISAADDRQIQNRIRLSR